jgi:hypothetical protein
LERFRNIEKAQCDENGEIAMVIQSPVLAMVPRKPIRAVVVQELSRMPLLTGKRLYNRVKANGLSVSYQAVHKVVNQLVELGVVNKIKKHYQLNPLWIARLKKFAEQVENANQEIALVHGFRCPTVDSKGNETFKTLEVLV